MTAAVYPPTMNTAFPTAPPPVTAPSLSPPQNVDQQLRYIQQSQYTPPASASGTPSNTSPTSPRTSWSLPPHMQPRVQQIRPPKSPMYVPAVLRPTEKPLRQSPPKNATATKYGSPDSLGEGSGQVPVSPGPVPGMSRVITDELNEEALGAVTGRPSRDHWKPDSAAIACNSPVCDKKFTFFERRHHCRRCGNIFCAEHSTHVIPLDQHARFHPQGSKNRACDSCFNDYRAWEVERVSRSNSSTSRDGAQQPPTPTVGVPSKGLGAGGIVGSLAQSLPRDWNWSTF